MKDLLKIKHIKDDVCEVTIDLETEEHAMLLSSILLGAMTKNPRLARAMIAAASLFMKAKSGHEEPQANGKKAS